MAENKMEYWFEEMHTSNVKMSIRVDQHLYSGTSEFRRIDVFDSPEFGKFLTSNGNVIFSEQEEFTYDEMIVHVPMAVHPNVKRVLVIGGGDGGVARELSHYKEIEVIDIAEPDKMFVDVCRKYFPDNAIGLEDVRVRLYYEDGGKRVYFMEDKFGERGNLMPRDVVSRTMYETGKDLGRSYRETAEGGLAKYYSAHTGAL